MHDSRCWYCIIDWDLCLDIFCLFLMYTIYWALSTEIPDHAHTELLYISLSPRRTSSENSTLMSCYKNWRSLGKVSVRRERSRTTLSQMGAATSPSQKPSTQSSPQRARKTSEVGEKIQPSVPAHFMLFQSLWPKLWESQLKPDVVLLLFFFFFF